MSITNVNNPHPQQNGVKSLPLLRFFPVYEQQLNWMCVCPWPPETTGPLGPSLELIVVDTPLTQAFWSLEVSTWHILCSSENPRDGGAWWAAIYGIAQSRTQLKPLSSSSRVSRKQCGPLFQAVQIPLQEKHHSHLYTCYLCVHVRSLDWKGRKRKRQRVLCVRSFHSQSRNNFRWRRVRERQISHDIAYLWHLRKWTNLQNRLTENEGYQMS